MLDSVLRLSSIRKVLSGETQVKTNKNKNKYISDDFKVFWYYQQPFF